MTEYANGVNNVVTANNEATASTRLTFANMKEVIGVFISSALVMLTQFSNGSINLFSSTG